MVLVENLNHQRITAACPLENPDKFVKIDSAFPFTKALVAFSLVAAQVAMAYPVGEPFNKLGKMVPVAVADGACPSPG